MLLLRYPRAKERTIMATVVVIFAFFNTENNGNVNNGFRVIFQVQKLTENCR
jgi:hypothetical protein